MSDQKTTDKAIPELLKCRDLAPVLFLSVEPLLDHIDLFDVGPYRHDVLRGWKPAHGNFPEGCNTDRIDWVIVGGESGHHARPCHLGWIDDIVSQCEDADIPCFVKQLGSDPRDKGGKLDWLKDRKGGAPSEWPEYLRIRQFPTLGN